ncbi:MAG: hypothetical protein NTW44_01110 [Nitrospirae bacterium]|nr:hypothetical protein [Nitrospirota bacterium]
MLEEKEKLKFLIIEGSGNPCKRLNWLKGFTGCLLKLTVKTFTGMFSGNYDLVLCFLS